MMDPQESTTKQNTAKQKEPYLAHIFRQLTSTLEKNSEILEAVVDKLALISNDSKKSPSDISSGSAIKGLPDIKKSEKVNNS